MTKLTKTDVSSKKDTRGIVCSGNADLLSATSLKLTKKDVIRIWVKPDYNENEELTELVRVSRLVEARNALKKRLEIIFESSNPVQSARNIVDEFLLGEQK